VLDQQEPRGFAGGQARRHLLDLILREPERVMILLLTAGLRGRGVALELEPEQSADDAAQVRRVRVLDHHDVV
jgi:hypothetical protein